MKDNFSNHYLLEEKLYITMLIFSILFSFISIIGNMIIGYSFSMNYKWIVLIIVSLLAVRFSLKKEYVIYHQITIFSLIIFVFLPNGYICSGGLNVFTTAYVFLICIGTCFILTGKIRLFFVASEIVVLICLLIIGMKYPHVIQQQDYGKQSKDMFIQMPLTVMAVAYIIIIFSNAYRKERKKLKNYSILLRKNNIKLRELSRKDELTGLYNRRYLFERLNKLKANMKKRNMSVILIMMDLDNFKWVNDNYGHAVGDNLLKTISCNIISVVKEKGFVGRYGGDEFIIILENVNMDEAIDITEEIMRTVKEIEYIGENKITVSGGMAKFTENDDIDDILANADRLLYQVKQNSKDNIIYEKDFEESIC